MCTFASSPTYYLHIHTPLLPATPSLMKLAYSLGYVLIYYGYFSREMSSRSNHKLPTQSITQTLPGPDGAKVSLKCLGSQTLSLFSLIISPISHAPSRNGLILIWPTSLGASSNNPSWNRFWLMVDHTPLSPLPPHSPKHLPSVSLSPSTIHMSLQSLTCVLFLCVLYRWAVCDDLIWSAQLCWARSVNTGNSGNYDQMKAPHDSQAWNLKTCARFLLLLWMWNVASVECWMLFLFCCFEHPVQVCMISLIILGRWQHASSSSLSRRVSMSSLPPHSTAGSRQRGRKRCPGGCQTFCHFLNNSVTV